MAFNSFRKIPVMNNCLRYLAEKRVNTKIEQITKYLKPHETILDVGCGNGILCKGLRDMGYEVSAVDINNNSFLPDVSPVIYDGEKLPYKDDEFDIIVLITVLHHATEPEKLLLEGKRVAKKLIIIEEIYGSTIEKYWVYFVDSLFNFEFFSHPHTNKTNTQWQDVFVEMNMVVSATVISKVFPWLQRVLYVVTKSDS